MDKEERYRTKETDVCGFMPATVRLFFLFFLFFLFCLFTSRHLPSRIHPAKLSH